MNPIMRMGTVGVLGFAVGAGAVGGGMYAYHQLNPSSSASGASSISNYATVAKSNSSPLPLGPDTVSNVVQRVKPAIVKVVAQVPQSHSGSSSNPFFGSLFGGGAASQTDIGSGFFFNSKGYILTNDHVIHNANHIAVYVQGYKKPFIAHRVGTDFATDLAVIKINAPKPMPTLALGNSTNTPVGSWAIAIGNPYNLSDTVTVGVVSAKGRPLTIGARNYRNLLQTSAAINPGNSGGPLLNLAGQVVGINTAVSTQGQGIGFAIPTSTVTKILPQLMQYGHVVRPWLGVFITNDSKHLAQQYHLPTSKGVAVIYVEPSSPASRAGLKAGEVITAVNGKTVATASQLKSLISQNKVGATVNLTVNNHGSVKKISPTLAQQPNRSITIPSSAGNQTF